MIPANARFPVLITRHIILHRQVLRIAINKSVIRRMRNVDGTQIMTWGD